MRVFLSGALLVLLLTAMVGAVPSLVWVAASAYRRRWNVRWLLIILGSVGVTCTAIVVALIPGSDDPMKLDAMRTFGIRAPLTEALYKFDSPRHFTGDGYSFRVYALPESVRQQFTTGSIRLQQEYPQPDPKLEGWRIEHWRESPLDKAFDKYVDFVRPTSGPLLEHFVAMQGALAKSGSYYALYVHEEGEVILDVLLLVVDLSELKLFVCDSET